jgi:hypothetical protein
VSAVKQQFLIQINGLASEEIVARTNPYIMEEGFFTGKWDNRTQK